MGTTTVSWTVGSSVSRGRGVGSFGSAAVIYVHSAAVICTSFGVASMRATYMITAPSSSAIPTLHGDNTPWVCAKKSPAAADKKEPSNVVLPAAEPMQQAAPIVRNDRTWHALQIRVTCFVSSTVSAGRSIGTCWPAYLGRVQGMPRVC